MNLPVPTAFAMMLDLTDDLAQSAIETVRAGTKKLATRRKVRRGGTLRPGTASPLWNEVVTAARPYLRKYGEKAILARILGVPRQRIHDYFVSCTAYPDAERLLLLLHWLAVRRSGKNPA